MTVCPVLCVFVHRGGRRDATPHRGEGGDGKRDRGILPGIHQSTGALLYRRGPIGRMDNTGRAATRGTSVVYRRVRHACVKRRVARWDRSRGPGLGVYPEPRIPGAERVLPLAVQHPRANLDQEMRTTLA